MDRFERFMEIWGLLTLDWTRSSRWYVRWSGIAIGAVAMWLMFLVMACWYVMQVAKLALVAVAGKRKK